MFEATRTDGVSRLRREGARWLSTGYDGGFADADAAYNVTVPNGFSRTDLGAFVAERRADAGFDDDGPALLTGVAQRHARRARFGPVEAVVTAGLSNPASLPDEAREARRDSGDARGEPSVATRAADDSPTTDSGGPTATGSDGPPTPGTVNVVLGTTRALDAGTQANLLALVAEARTATLLATTGFTGTTSDAAIVACDPTGDPAAFAGSATEVGHAARVCVRDALRASLASRYPDDGYPDSVADADHGVVTEGRADVSAL
ncbi:MAG: adenosylcobinamide amidohydrolase [Haloferacaceae archaeon]